jgi:hypothetical protein
LATDGKEFSVMRMFERGSTLLTLFLVILTPAVSSAQVSARLKLTLAQISDMKSHYYHIERVGIKYQPYIITYDNQELVQFVYDTREEAETRVDEITEEDRLDRLGVKGRQNKKVGIREVKQNFHEIISRGTLEKFATKLAVEQKAHYKGEGKQTRCSEFVRDFAKELLGRTLPELGGLALHQLYNLKAAATSPESRWRSLSFSDDPAAAFQNAQDLANAGKLVIVAWKNPDRTRHDPGHSAVVVPSRQADGGLFDATKRKWGMKVPYIAQAGETVSDYIPLSDGFSPAKKAGMEIYVRSP